MRTLICCWVPNSRMMNDKHWLDQSMLMSHFSKRCKRDWWSASWSTDLPFTVRCIGLACFSSWRLLLLGDGGGIDWWFCWMIVCDCCAARFVNWLICWLAIWLDIDWTERSDWLMNTLFEWAACSAVTAAAGETLWTKGLQTSSNTNRRIVGLNGWLIDRLSDWPNRNWLLVDLDGEWCFT